MPVIDTKARRITCKLVYYGPGLGGKTTNLKVIHQKTNPKQRGKLLFGIFLGKVIDAVFIQSQIVVIGKSTRFGPLRRAR